MAPPFQLVDYEKDRQKSLSRNIPSVQESRQDIPQFGIYLVYPLAGKYYILYFRRYLYTLFFICQVLFFTGVPQFFEAWRKIRDMYRMRPLIMNAGHPEKMHSVTCPWIFSIPDEYLFIAKIVGTIDTERRKNGGSPVIF
jgi:hypothetical protein